MLVGTPLCGLKHALQELCDEWQMGTPAAQHRVAGRARRCPQRAANEEINAQVAAAFAKDRENSQLWEQARPPEPPQAATALSR